ncbi:DUF4344 domain-containing metallopeptidase [Falsigemmobacter faecalis]|uniref:Rhodanese domain-containing protein n=1 Tax=Falsigemmobacter faecalis TaxID=2488730 RepID=A0A3P3DPY2_9RHOB|nr:DUF4344 domain-containing metallopeptidase [Falsigemmobacter faecalis]RRH76211.1 hypothetical protein EG244_07315 [Falsigemmobacter faecalis]
MGEFAGFLPGLILALVLPAGLAKAADLGPLNGALAQQVQGWQQSEQDGIVLLSSDGSTDRGRFLLWDAGPAPQPLRSSLLTFTYQGRDARSSLNFLVGNIDTGESCFLAVYPNRDVALNCMNDQGATTLARHEGLAKLDGSDRLQVIEEAGAVTFYLNDAQVARIAGHPAQGGDMGVALFGAGDFMLGHFSVVVPDGTAPATKAPAAGGVAEAPVAETGNRPPDDTHNGRALLDQVFANAPAPRGWQVQDREEGWQVQNADRAGAEYLLPLGLPAANEARRVVSVDVMLAPAGQAQMSARAAAGIFWENPRNGQSCSVQVTSAGDGLMVCFSASGRAVEVGRLPGVVSGPGPHILAVIENGSELTGMIGTDEIATLKGHPSLGGTLALYAYERGAFTYSDLVIQTLGAPTTSAPVETRVPEKTMGTGLSGPLPQFGGDADRMAAAYLGISRSIFLHELGHALIGELAVPSTGPEEDAVDIYSALQMADATVTPAGHALLDRTAPMAAGYAALAWYYSGRVNEQAPQSDGAWQDEHTADLKRFRNMFCVIYGASPAKFSSLAAVVKMEERTLARCEEEFRKQNRAWRAILAPYSRISAENPEGLLPATAPGAEVEVELKPSGRQVGEFLRQSYGDVLRETALSVGRAFALPRPLKITYQDCDVVNAWYAPREGSITMCYEIIEHFAVLISDIEEGTRDGYEQMASAGTPARSAPTPGAAPQTAPQNTAAAVDELADAGVPATLRLFTAPYRGGTPNSHPRAVLTTTEQLSQMLRQNPPPALLDIRPGEGLQSLPGAVSVPGLGDDGGLSDGLQTRVERFVRGFTEGDPAQPLVIFGAGPEDRAAYNAALRVASTGQSTFWYRGGIAAWTALGLPLAAVE